MPKSSEALPSRADVVRGISIAAVAALSLLPNRAALAQGTPDYELPPIEYSTRTPHNQVSDLEARIAARPPGLTGSSLIRWLLNELEVPAESQVLVFSKTSLQRDLIHPGRPRALYFSDDVYVGWVPGGLIELAVTDPQLGLVFYKLDPRGGPHASQVERDADCLSCHAGSMTRQWPGLVVRSVFPDSRGEPITSAGSVLVGHDTPFHERWGGWYVTGHHGTARHRGNAIARPVPRGAQLDTEAGANLEKLDAYFNPSPYVRADSDIVALMVLEHQTLVHNRLCEGGLRVRRWTHYQRQLQKELGEPISEKPVGTALRVVTSETERIVEALLFCDEITLPEGGIRGAGDFEKAFTTNRRVDACGRSLKDFDLQTHLFTWRCSYMIHSKAFEALPDELKTAVFNRLEELLTSPSVPKRFQHLSDKERIGIREILLETVPGFGCQEKQHASLAQ